MVNTTQTGTSDEQVQAISLDVMAEALNLGLGHVIEELAEISGSKIDLHVPEVNMLPKQSVLDFTDRMRGAGKAIFVQQAFSGDISGEALLFFSEEESLHLLSSLLDCHGEDAVECTLKEERMLLDLTNVSVSGVIYGLSNLLALRIDTESPRCEYGSFDDVIKSNTDILDDIDDRVLFLTISFTVVQKNAKAQLMFFQSKGTLAKLYDHIKKRMGI